MSDVHQWCQRKKKEMEELVNSFYKQQPAREQRPPTHDASDLIRISGVISGNRDTLRYISKSKSLIKELAGIVGNERTPDNAYFGPAPNLSLGDAGGMASAAGALADLGGGILAVFKGISAEKKMVKALTENAQAISEYKIQMLRDYEELVQLLRFLIERGAESEMVAAKLEKEGLNVPILNNSWRTVVNNQWLVLTC